MTRRLFSKNRGFTLVEAMVAVTILGVALGACCMSFSFAMRAVKTAGNQMDSLQEARNQIETLRTYKFTNSVLNAGTYGISNQYFTGTYVITNVDSYTKDIYVNISYRNFLRGGNSTNTLYTSITKTLHNCSFCV